MIKFDNIPDKTKFKSTTSHKFKKDVIDFFKDKNLNNCLELGTNHGWSSRILSVVFKEIHTIDYSIENINNAKQNNIDRDNIIYYVGDCYNSNTFVNMPKMDVVFIDCVHTYEHVIFDINTAMSLFDVNKGIYLIFDDYGHPEALGVKHAILESINKGLKLESYIGQQSGYTYNLHTTLVDHEGVILSYGK